MVVEEALVAEKEAMVAEKVAMVVEEALVAEEEAWAADKETMVVENESDKAEECKSVETDNLGEPEDKKDDNVVLRKLIGLGTLIPQIAVEEHANCGEEGHTAVKCKSAKRTKPCFVCGSLEHNVKQCTKVGCFRELGPTMLLMGENEAESLPSSDSDDV